MRVVSPLGGARGSGLTGSELAKRQVRYLNALGTFNGVIFDIDGALSEDQLGMATSRSYDALECALVAYFAREGFGPSREEDCWTLAEMFLDPVDWEAADQLFGTNPMSDLAVRELAANVQTFAAERLGVVSFGLTKDNATEYIEALRDAISLSHELSDGAGPRMVLDPAASLEAMSETPNASS